MYLKEINLKNFRNIESQSLRLNPKVNIFIGQNGQGKTNLLEAVYLICSGGSFRTAKTENLVKKFTGFSSIKSEVHIDPLNHYVQINLSENKKQISLNEKKATASLLVEKLPKVLFSPESLSSIKEGPEQRRQLIDEALVLSEPRNAELYSDFLKTLRVRNKILKQYVEKEIGSEQFNNLFHSINEPFLKNAFELTIARIRALRELEPVCAQNFQKIAGRPHQVRFEYLMSEENVIAERKEEEIRNAIHKRAQELATAEASLGLSLVGPHKHDFRIIFDGHDSRVFCSQGQQRALILSFKIAQIVHYYEKHATYPLLLLDDVLSELDQEKRFFLVRFLKEIDTQTLVTSTEMSFFEELKAGPISIFEVNNGTFELVQG